MEDIAKFAAVVDVIGKLILGLVGFYLAHNFRRQIKQKSADGRMKASSKLWEKMDVASPTRLEEWYSGPLKGPLTSSERIKLTR